MIGNSNKSLIGLIIVVFLIILISIMFNSTTTKKEDEYEAEPELYVEQIWFKNIEMLNDIPIDQSLLIQDEITYYLKEKKIEEVELQQGTLKDFGDYKIEFKVTYNEGTLIVKVDKNKVAIEE